MANIVQIRSLVRVAKQKRFSDPLGFLTELLVALYDTNISDGRVVISTMEAGGTVTFHIPQGMSPLELASLVEESIEWLQQQVDPKNPNLSPQRIRRARVSFKKAFI